MSKKANIIITADSKGVDKAVNSANSSLGKLGKSAGATGSAMGGLTTAGVALGTAIGSLVVKAFSALTNEMDAAISRLDTLNNFPRVMSNLKISSEDSNKSIAILSEKLRGLPTSLDDAAQSVQRFTAANGNIKASTSMFLALNNAILAGGASAQLQSSALEQLSQAYTKGKPDAMEWRALMQAMPAQMNQIAQAMGYTSAALGGDLQTALNKGEVSMNDFMATIVKLNKEGVNGFASFSEQAVSATTGVGTAMTNLKLSIQRGLADIMNAIGQSNIAGFFNGIASAIGTAANYVVAFVKLMVKAINAIRSLLGLGKSAGTSTSNAMADAGASAGALAENADDVAGGLGSANKQAKQLKKTLAGFDEMTVLQEPSDSGSGGGSSGGGGAGLGDLSGIDLSFWDDFNAGESEAEKIFQRLQDAINKLNFNKWHKAIQEFKKGFKNALTIVEGIAVKTWDNIFVPLAKHLVENSLPDYIEGVGKAFQKLTPETWLKGFETFSNGLATTFKGVLDVIVPVVTAIMNFIYALADWVVPPALSILGATFEIIGNVLTGIGEGFMYVWTEEIEPALATFGEFMAPIITKIQEMFDAIQKCTPLMEFFKALGQAIGIIVGAAFEGIVDAIMVVVGAIGIVIDFFIEMGTWAGEVILNICDFFTWLGKNIDDIFKGVGEFVGGIFKGIWDTLVRIFTPIGQFFSGLLDGVKNVFTNAWNALKTGAQGAWNAIKNIFSSVASFFGTIFTNAWNAVKAVFSTGGQIFMGIVDGIANAFKTIVNAIISGINAVVAVPFNAINGMLNTVRSIDILGIKPFGWVGTISVPQIPQLAKGGIVDDATIAMIGEQGKEAVVPLENNTEWIDQLAEQLKEDSNQNITIMIGEETIVDTIINKINARTTLNNRSVIKL